MRKITSLAAILPILVLIPIAAAHAACQFAADGGTFVTLARNGTRTTFQMSYSSGGEPRFDGTYLGTFSLADEDTLVLTGFNNYTYESGGQSIFLGRLAHKVQAVGGSGTFTTNISTAWYATDTGWEHHYATNLSINLLSGLTNGTYEIEVYALANGNFSPDLIEDNGGSNFVATFTVTEDPLPEPETVVTPNGKVILPFTHTTNTGFGNELYVVGNHPDVGAWDPIHARKLHWTDGNVWTGQIAVQEGYALEYKFIVRTNSADVICDAANVSWPAGANLTTNVPDGPVAPYGSKAVYYHSGWTNANLIYQCGLDTNWYAKAMTRIGDGRTAGEYLYYADGIGQPGELLTFVPSGYLNSTQYWDHSPANGSNYCTPLDVSFLQDGNVFNYRPPAALSPSITITTTVASSWAPTIPSRTVWIYLPRNYATNTWKSYPVLYMHDGTNVFQPGGIYGCWYAETNADNLISLGVMRETIIVGVDNSPERNREYIAPGDNAGYGPGTADQYANFLLHNVRPMIDATYRTLTNRENTLTMGSSFGGNVSLYLGLGTNAFSKIGVVSPAFWAVTNMIHNLVDLGDSFGLRTYMDMGTEEGGSAWGNVWVVYDLLLTDGYSVNNDLRMETGCGQEHNEPAWDARLPFAFEFLLPIGDEANLLAQSDHPPSAESLEADRTGVTISTPALKGRRYRLDRTLDLANPSWQGVATSAVETLMWSTAILSDTSNPSGDRHYYRIAAEPTE